MNDNNPPNPEEAKDIDSTEEDNLIIAPPGFFNYVGDPVYEPPKGEN